MKPISKHSIQLIADDITTLQVDAIINAANTSLLGGGGVDGAIHQAAGPGLLKECSSLGGCPTGEARLTKGYNLPAAHVIHTVGPIWADGNRGEAELLASCYRNCFQIAMEHDLHSLAFPAISTGVYGYPPEEAAGIALRETRTVLADKGGLEKIFFVCFNPRTRQAYKQQLKPGEGNAAL